MYDVPLKSPEKYIKLQRTAPITVVFKGLECVCQSCSQTTEMPECTHKVCSSAMGMALLSALMWCNEQKIKSISLTQYFFVQIDEVTCFHFLMVTLVYFRYRWFWGYLFALLICEESSASPLSLIACSGFVSCKNTSMSSFVSPVEQKANVFRKIFENQILPRTDLVKINSMFVSFACRQSKTLKE